MTKRQSKGGNWNESDDGVDLINTEPFAVQCKNLSDYCPVSTIEEINMKPDKWKAIDAEIEIEKEYWPIVITKADRKPTMAILPWDILKELIRHEKL